LLLVVWLNVKVEGKEKGLKRVKEISIKRRNKKFVCFVDVLFELFCCSVVLLEVKNGKKKVKKKVRISHSFPNRRFTTT